MARLEIQRRTWTRRDRATGAIISQGESPCWYGRMKVDGRWKWFKLYTDKRASQSRWMQLIQAQELRDAGAAGVAELESLLAAARASARVRSNSDADAPKPAAEGATVSPQDEPRRHLKADLCATVGLSSDRMSHFIDLAGVPRPTRGRRNHRYTDAEARKVYATIDRECPTEPCKLAARAAIASLSSISEVPNGVA